MASEKTGMALGGAIGAPVALGVVAVVAVIAGSGWYFLQGNEGAPSAVISATKAPVAGTVEGPAAAGGPSAGAKTDAATAGAGAGTKADSTATASKAPDTATGAATGAVTGTVPDTASATAANGNGFAPVAPTGAEALPTDPKVPNFDNWRVAGNGEAVVAGRALPGASVSVLIDGKEVAQTQVGGDGAFATLFSLPANPQPSLMVLETTLPDGSKVRSQQEVALAPIAGMAQAGTDVPPAPPAALLLNEAGVQVAQSATPETEASAALPGEVKPVVLDAIAYSPAGEVQLSGKGQPGQSVRIYLDGKPISDLSIGMGGQWQTTLAAIEPGIYTLRLDQLDQSGKVSARFETPFKRETSQALAAMMTPATGGSGAPNTSALSQAPKAEGEMQADAPATLPGEERAPNATAPAEPAAPQAGQAITITVQPGFTLWGIARERFGDGVLYVQVYEANRDKIRNPDLIYPGQVFSLPGAP